MLKLQNIKKSFDGKEVLKDISIEVGDGEIVSILGPSGCGKTTLLNIILGLTNPRLRRNKLQRRGYNKSSYGKKRIQYSVPGLHIIPKFKCLPEHNIRSKK